jgi:small subunit ribosomal protein S9
MANKLKKKTSVQVQKVVKKPTTEVAGAKSASRSSVGGSATTHFRMPGGEYVAAVGRRKTATARVRLYKSSGDFAVNDRLVSEYFGGVLKAPALYTRPFVTTGTQGKYAVSVKVSGSGIQAQLSAVMHGVSRALVALNPEFRGLLREAGLLTRDDRMKETRKIGTGGKARRTKQSPKR